MQHVLAAGLLAVRQPHDVLLEREEFAAMNRRRSDGCFLEMIVR
jgi:hypothetical protein